MDTQQASSIKPDWIDKLSGIVLSVYTIAYLSVGYVKEILTQRWSLLILISLVFFVIARQCRKIIRLRRTSEGLAWRFSSEWRKRAKRILVASSCLYAIIAVYIFNKKAVDLFIRMRGSPVIILNNFTADPSNDFSDRVWHFLSVKKHDTIDLVVDSINYSVLQKSREQQDALFADRQYSRGILAYGLYREIGAVQVSLKASIYIRNMSLPPMYRSTHTLHLRSLDTLNDIRIQERAEWLGRLILAILHQRQGKYISSQWIVQRILQDSSILSDDFRFHLFFLGGVNYAALSEFHLSDSLFKKALLLRPFSVEVQHNMNELENLRRFMERRLPVTSFKWPDGGYGLLRGRDTLSDIRYDSIVSYYGFIGGAMRNPGNWTGGMILRRSGRYFSLHPNRDTLPLPLHVKTFEDAREAAERQWEW
ncbi:MAG TPA: hypothetical protein VD996_12985 [Chitinophagaceae bacterium]|nr:hypothetical protein [Chitinophagaceae bacterium]